MSLINIFDSLKRKKARRKTIASILSNVQFNNGVSNVHRIDKDNVGDYFCAPHHYFDTLKDTELDIYDYQRLSKDTTDNFIDKVSNNSLIIGGGGLLNRQSFEKQMKLFEALSEKNKKTVLWGVGHNTKIKNTYGNVSHYNIDTSKFGLVGTRDFSMPGIYVPCVSCMHPVFDKKYTETEELGVIFHKNTVKNKKITSKFSHLPSTSNTTNMEDLISFIGKHKNIITNSYHAMYWSMLLDKKVTVVPNSSKFFDFKYLPQYSSFENSLNDYKKAHTYSGILEESRQINRAFYEKVANYLNI